MVKTIPEYSDTALDQSKMRLSFTHTSPLEAEDDKSISSEFDSDQLLRNRSNIPQLVHSTRALVNTKNRPAHRKPLRIKALEPVPRNVTRIVTSVGVLHNRYIQVGVQIGAKSDEKPILDKFVDDFHDQQPVEPFNVVDSIQWSDVEPEATVRHQRETKINLNLPVESTEFDRYRREKCNERACDYDKCDDTCDNDKRDDACDYDTRDDACDYDKRDDICSDCKSLGYKTQYPINGITPDMGNDASLELHLEQTKTIVTAAPLPIASTEVSYLKSLDNTTSASDMLDHCICSDTDIRNNISIGISRSLNYLDDAKSKDLANHIVTEATLLIASIEVNDGQLKSLDNAVSASDILHNCICSDNNIPIDFSRSLTILDDTKSKDIANVIVTEATLPITPMEVSNSHSQSVYNTVSAGDMLDHCIYSDSDIPNAIPIDFSRSLTVLDDTKSKDLANVIVTVATLPNTSMEVSYRYLQSLDNTVSASDMLDRCIYSDTDIPNGISRSLTGLYDANSKDPAKVVADFVTNTSSLTNVTNKDLAIIVATEATLPITSIEVNDGQLQALDNTVSASDMLDHCICSDKDILIGISRSLTGLDDAMSKDPTNVVADFVSNKSFLTNVTNKDLAIVFTTEATLSIASLEVNDGQLQSLDNTVSASDILHNCICSDKDIPIDVSRSLAGLDDTKSKDLAKVVTDCTSHTSALTNVSNKDCSSLRNVTIKDCSSLTNVTNKDCSSLTIVTIKDCSSLTNTTNKVCSSLTDVTIKDCLSLTNITNKDCSSLPNVTNKDCSSLKNVMSKDCSSLTNVTNKDCSSLTNVTNKDCSSLTNVTNKDCSSLTNVTNKDCLSLTNITNKDCLSLTNVTNKDWSNIKSSSREIIKIQTPVTSCTGLMSSSSCTGLMSGRSRTGLMSGNSCTGLISANSCTALMFLRNNILHFESNRPQKEQHTCLLSTSPRRSTNCRIKLRKMSADAEFDSMSSVELYKFIPVYLPLPVILNPIPHNKIDRSEWARAQEALENYLRVSGTMLSPICRTRSETFVSDAASSVNIFGPFTPTHDELRRGKRSNFNTENLTKVACFSQVAFLHYPPLCDDRFDEQRNIDFCYINSFTTPDFRSVLYVRMVDKPNITIYNLKIELSFLALSTFFHPFSKIEISYVKNIRNKIVNLFKNGGEMLELKFNTNNSTVVCPRKFDALLVLSPDAGSILRHNGSTNLMCSLAAVFQVHPSKFLVIVNHGNALLSTD